MLNRHNALALGSLLLTLGPTGPLAAQVSWSARLGATYTTSMVTDRLGTEKIELAPGMSPALNVEAALPLRTKTPLSALFGLQATTGTLRRTEGGTSTDLASMRTFALTVGVRAQFLGPVTWRAGAGVVSYATSEKASIFQDGAPTRLLAMAGIEYRRPLTPGYTLTGVLGYDAHGFTTEQLKSSGYTGSQLVNRVTLSLGVSR